MALSKNIIIIIRDPVYLNTATKCTCPVLSHKKEQDTENCSSQTNPNETWCHLVLQY